MISFLIWFGGLVFILMLAHVTPVKQQTWLIVEASLFVFWCGLGTFLAFRGMWRIFRAH